MQGNHPWKCGETQGYGVTGDSGLWRDPMDGEFDGMDSATVSSIVMRCNVLHYTVILCIIIFIL